MNRKILFRGKRVDNGEWVYGYLCSKRTIKVISPIGNVDEIVSGSITYSSTFTIRKITPYVVDPDTVGQYTGLSDRLGNHVFDGDIVQWDEREWGCEHREVVKWDYELLNMRKNDWREHCEVVGNITDNPDMVTDKEDL